VPTQLLVRAPKAGNKITPLPHDTSLFEMRGSLPPPHEITVLQGLRCFTFSAALVSASAGFFRQYPTDARAALGMVRDAAQVLEELLDGGHSTVAGRLAGAFRNIGRDR